MKKIVLTFGLIAGAILSLMMLATLPFMDKVGFDKGYVIGYTSMVLAFLLVFFGIRSYRENIGGGAITFGRAFSVGILIVLIASACYVVTWEIVYFKLAPGFADRYANYVMEKLRSSGASQQALQAKLEEMKMLKGMMDNPLTNAALSFIEPLPVGLIITLISAAVLRKKGRSGEVGVSKQGFASPRKNILPNVYQG
jgi:hypothetical protein